jgi:hypothetical protein
MTVNYRSANWPISYLICPAYVAIVCDVGVVAILKAGYRVFARGLLADARWPA